MYLSSNYVAGQAPFHHPHNTQTCSRSLGLVDILDQAPDGEGHTKGICDAKAVPIAEIQGLDITDWFDSVNINVNYVCARSLMDYNPELAEGIAKYVSDS